MINPTALTKNDPYLLSVYNDKLVLPFLGAAMAASLLEGTAFVKKNAKKFDKPVLIFHGKQDSVTNYLDSIYFYEKCQRYKFNIYSL